MGVSMSDFTNFITTILIRLYSLAVLRPLTKEQKTILVDRFQQKGVLLRHIKRLAKYDLGEWSYGEPKVFDFGACATLKVGKFCSFGPGVKILLGEEHRIDTVTTYPFSSIFRYASHLPDITWTKGDVVIGSDVWIGQESLILSGVKIGNGAVIGARTTVVRDIAPYSITAGCPGTHRRFRFDQGKIEMLERIAWWDWPMERIEQALPLLLSNRIEEFLEKYAE